MRWIFNSPAAVDHGQVVGAIKAAEAKTSGEIRVVLARHRTADPMAAAQHHFERLGMQATAERNGVLIFVAPRSRNFAIVGDKAIHEKCSHGFWAAVAAAMTTHFKRDDPTAAIVHAISEAGHQLQRHFPAESAPKNQLPDEIEEV